jgi:hypothetical protein
MNHHTWPHVTIFKSYSLAWRIVTLSKKKEKPKKLFNILQSMTEKDPGREESSTMVMAYGNRLGETLETRSCFLLLCLSPAVTPDTLEEV